MTTIRESLDVALANGGATLDARTLDAIEPRDTWAVGSSKGIATVTVTVPSSDTLAQYRAAYLTILEARAPVIGLWLDDGTLCVDAVDLIDDTVLARYAGKLRGEKAIYNLLTEETVWLNDDAAISRGAGFADTASDVRVKTKTVEQRQRQVSRQRANLRTINAR